MSEFSLDMAADDQQNRIATKDINEEEEEVLKPTVTYTVTCRDMKLGRTQRFQSTINPFANVKIQSPIVRKPPVIEVFLEATGLGGHPSWRPETMPHPGPGPSYNSGSRQSAGQFCTEQQLNEALSSFQPGNVRTTALHIHSHHLQKLLRSITANHPSLSLKADPIIIEHPLIILMQHFDQLSEILATKTIPHTESQSSSTTALDNETHHDLRILLDFLGPIYAQDIQIHKKRQDTGLVTFEMLWLLFVRGSYVYSNESGKLRAYVVLVGEFTNPPRPGASGRVFRVTCEHLLLKARMIGPSSRTFDIQSFNGEKEITSLLIYPASSCDLNTPNARLEIESRGKRCYEYIRKMPLHAVYSGPSWKVPQVGFLMRSDRDEFPPPPTSNMPFAWKPDATFEGEVIFDPVTYKKLFGTSNGYSGDNLESYESRAFREITPIIAPRLVFFDPVARETLEPHEYFLFGGMFQAYAIREKNWIGVDVDNMSEIEWKASPQEVMKRLILPERDIEMIQALSQTFQKGQPKFWGADFVAGKGEGQIFLLHGGPGTGKTYTVECVAESSRTPLLSLTVADIGTDELDMERRLSHWLTLAASWNAIMLIDEADVFLEKRRSGPDALRRNSLVSVLLRCLEYYKGLLFLTTNRVGHIDDAFHSRISIALFYPTLDITKQRQIWKNFIKKLKKERTDIAITYRADLFVTEGEEMASITWNGREIRNALQSAIALARYQADEMATPTTKIEVDVEHFQKVFDRKKAFQEDSTRITGNDESKRAWADKSRARET